MTPTQANSRIDESERQLRDAKAELDKGAAIFASRIAWEAVAGYLAFAGERRGWRTDAHNDLCNIAFALAADTELPDMAKELFLVANCLRTDAMEGWLSNTLREAGLDDARFFLRALDRASSRAPSKPDANRRLPASHPEMSARYLRTAQDWFADGFLEEAAGKVWMAVSHYVRAVADERGWESESHRDLYAAAYDLTRETDDPERAERLFSSLNGITMTGYTGGASDWMVQDGIAAARETLRLLESRSKQPISPRPSSTPFTQKIGDDTYRFANLNARPTRIPKANP